MIFLQYIIKIEVTRCGINIIVIFFIEIANLYKMVRDER